MFEKIQGGSEKNFKTQTKTENFNSPSTISARNLEEKLNSKTNLEPTPKLIFVDPPSKKVNPTKLEAEKKSSKYSINNYFLSSNLATNKNPDAMTTTPIRS